MPKASFAKIANWSPVCPRERDLALPVVAADRGSDQFEELADRFAQNFRRLSSAWKRRSGAFGGTRAASAAPARRRSPRAGRRASTSRSPA
jgi:hypothetical protein